MRDDGILNTGIGSQSFGTTREAQLQQAKRDEESEKKEAKRQVLKPAGELVRTAITKQLKNLRDKEIDTTLPADEIKIEVVARERAKETILAFQNDILNTLREK